MGWTGEQGPTSRDALSALAWLVEAGIDALVEDRPRSWLVDESATPTPAVPTIDERTTAEPAPQFVSQIARTQATSDAAGRAATAAAAAQDLAALRAAVETFDGSTQRGPRTKTIFADGDPASGVMIVGEGPAADDDRTGKPFSGPSGALLDRMLAAIGRDRSGCYLTNLLLWRGPGGRPASDEEVALCTPFLRRHIELARPRVLLIMGGMPAKALLETDTGITKLRGRWLDLTVGDLTVPALPTFNPAYLLRVAAHKGLAWTDLLAFKARID